MAPRTHGWSRSAALQSVAGLVAMAIAWVTWGCDGRGDRAKRGQDRPAGDEPQSASPETDAPPDPGPERDGVRASDAQALPRYQVFATPREALEVILASKPRVLGFGEYHELTGSEKVQSALHRFTEQMLALLEGRASDLIVETWVEAGKCGKQEERFSKDVKKVTERPAHTENQLARLIRQAKKLRIRPHILELRCEDFKALVGKGGEVDYEKLLQMVTKKLQDKAVRALERSSRERIVVLYGGALHNDRYPYETVRDFSYAAAVNERSQGGYVEVDLYVPEYVEDDELLSKEDWFPLLERLSSPDKVLLIERGKGSYILVLRRALQP